MLSLEERARSTRPKSRIGRFLMVSFLAATSVNRGVELNRIAFAFDRFGELDFSVSWQDVHSLAAYSD